MAERIDAANTAILAAEKSVCWGTPSRPVDDHSKIESLAVERKITSRYGVDSRPLSKWATDARHAAPGVRCFPPRVLA